MATELFLGRQSNHVRLLRAGRGTFYEALSRYKNGNTEASQALSQLAQTQALLAVADTLNRLKNKLDDSITKPLVAIKNRMNPR